MTKTLRHTVKDEANDPPRCLTSLRLHYTAFVNNLLERSSLGMLTRLVYEYGNKIPTVRCRLCYRSGGRRSAHSMWCLRVFWM